MIPKLYTRRRFLNAAAGCRAWCARGSCSRNFLHAAPPAHHLLLRLGLDYLRDSGEAFHDLERALRETRERGYNTVRIEAGLNWMFDLNGNRRGKLKFLDWIPGFSSNLPVLMPRVAACTTFSSE